MWEKIDLENIEESEALSFLIDKLGSKMEALPEDEEKEADRVEDLIDESKVIRVIEGNSYRNIISEHTLKDGSKIYEDRESGPEGTYSNYIRKIG